MASSFLVYLSLCFCFFSIFSTEPITDYLILT
jgi:hypothetical protein